MSKWTKKGAVCGRKLDESKLKKEKHREKTNKRGKIKEKMKIFIFCQQKLKMDFRIDTHK